MNRNIYPLTLSDLKGLVETLGFHVQEDDENRRLTLFLEGEETRLMVHVMLGGNADEPPWYVRLLSYSVEFEPLALGIDRVALAHWLNERNGQILFGRYYHDPRTDTLAFELSMPGIGGILGEDFVRMLWIATASVDKVHGEIKALVPGTPPPKKGDDEPVQ
jgi:hypothetical protein